MAMTLRLTDEQTARLRALAADEGVSMHAMVLKALDRYAENKSQLRERLLAEIVSENADVLRRLG
jgi:predicted transcriptional regulator